MTKLSILVPTFNRVDYLRECLESLLTTTVNCEIVVSDNASTDGTEAYMRGLSDPRIRYVRQASNIGPVENYNFLLAEARGEYICLFGDDDRALPDCFERKVALLDEFEAIDMVYSLTHVIDPQGKQLNVRGVMGHLSHSYLGGRNEFNELLFNCFIAWQALVFRRQVYEATGPLQSWGLRVSNDWYWLQKAVRRREVAFLHQRTVEVRVHPGSMSVSQGLQQGHFMEDRVDIWHKWLLEDADPPVVTEAAWDKMTQVLAAEAHSIHGGDPARVDSYIQKLAAMKLAYSKRMEARFQAFSSLSEHFRPGLPAWSLESRNRAAYLYLPNWASSEWATVLRSYCQAFTAGDESTLVIWLDPAQGLTLEQAYAAIVQAMGEAGIDPDRCPDVLVVPDAQTPSDLARLFAAVDWVVPAGDELQAERANRLGKPCLTSLALEAWRETLAQYDRAPA